MGKLLIDGEVFREDDLAVSVDDLGFLSGFGIYETIKVAGSKPVLLDEHLSRMKNSLDYFRFEEVDDELIRGSINSTIVENNLVDGFVKPIVTWGPEGGGKPKLICLCGVRLVPESIRSDGASVEISDLRRFSGDYLRRHKSLNNLLNTFERSKARVRSLWDVLYLDENDFVCESSSANIFCLKDELLFTPTLERPILAGVTRAHILKNAVGWGFEAVEKDFDREFLLDSDEVFLSSAVAELIPVTKIDGKKIGDGLVGGCYKSILKGIQDFTH